MKRCMPRTLPPATSSAMGSMDWRSSALHWPTIELKKCPRGSLRAKQERKCSWKVRSSSRNPSTSRGVSSNRGRANPSSGVRLSGNIFGLLRGVICMFGGNVGKENQHVKCRRRCRDNSPSVQQGLGGGRYAVPSRNGQKGGRQRGGWDRGHGGWLLRQWRDHRGRVGLRDAEPLG